MQTSLRHCFRGLPPWPLRGSAHPDHKDARGLRDVTVLIVRRAENSDQRDGLSPRGEQRALAYASYFDPLRLDGSTLVPQRLIATSDSMRVRLSLMPMAATS